MKTIISKEFIIYCLVGVVNTLVGTTTAIVSLNVFMLNYAVSTVLCYITGIIVSFFLNKKYTFQNKEKSFSQFVKFFMTMLPSYIFAYWFGYTITHFTVKYCPKTLNLISEYINIPQVRIVDNIALFISILIHLLVGFSINKFYIFKKKNLQEK